MSRRDIIVDEGSGWSAATFAIIALVIVAAAIALFVWQPWNTSHSSTTTTTVTQPGSNANGNTSGGTTSGTSGGSSSSTTTTGH